MGNFATSIKRIIRSITTTNQRADGGPYVDYLPYGLGPLGAPVTLYSYGSSSAGDVLKYSKIQAIAVAASDCWLVGLQVSDPSLKDNAMYIAITRAAAGAYLAAEVQVEAEVPIHVEAAVEDLCSYVPIKPPIYFPVGGLINAAVASEATGATALGNSIDAYAIVALQK